MIKNLYLTKAEYQSCCFWLTFNLMKRRNENFKKYINKITPALLNAGCQGKRSLSKSTLWRICRCRKSKQSKYQFFSLSIFTTESTNGPKGVKNSKSLGIYLFIYLLHSQPVTIRCLNLVSSWLANGHKQLTRAAEREPGEISHLPRFQRLQNHSHHWRSLMWLVDVHSSAPPPQHSYRHDTSAALHSQSQLCNVHSTSRAIMLHDALK